MVEYILKLNSLRHHLRKMPATSRVYTALFGETAPWESLITTRISMFPSAQQVGTFSNTSSDHLLTVFELGHKDRLFFSWNTMMQANTFRDAMGNIKKTNTAFGHTENDEEYRRRIASNVNTISELLHNNPNIMAFKLQEAPIRDHRVFFESLLKSKLPKHWDPDQLLIKTTEWGVMTLINHSRFNTTAKVLDLTEGITIREINERCQTIALTQGDKTELLTNVHLPHGDPEAAFLAFLINAIKHRMHQTDASPYKRHTIAGDFNIEPPALKRLIQTAQNIVEKDLNALGMDVPMHIKLSFFYSHEGHLKCDGLKKSVDGALSMEFNRSDQHEYTFNSERIQDEPLILGIVAMTCGSTLLFAKKETKKKKNEQENVRLIADASQCGAEYIEINSSIKAKLNQLKQSDEPVESSKNKPL